MGTLNPDLLSEELTGVLNQAIIGMDQRKQRVLSAEIVLDAMLRDPENAAHRLLDQYAEERGLDLERLARQVRLAAERRRAQSAKLDFLADGDRRVPISTDMVIALDEGLSIAQADGEVYINTDHLLLGMSERRASTAGLLRQHGILPKAPASTAAGPRPAGRGGATTVDHVAEAKAGRFRPVYFREGLLRDMVNILSQKENRHLILLGPDGVGKRTLTLSLAQLIAEGKGPAGVERLVQIEEPALIDNPLTAIQSGLKRAKGGILFLPHIHRFFGGPIKADRFHQITPKVQKAFHSDDPVLVGTTNEVEYDARLSPIPAITENSQLLRVPQPDEGETVEILRVLKPHLEVDYELEIVEDALRVAATMARRYLSGTALPRAAEQLLHRTSAIVSRVAQQHLPQESSAQADRRLDAEDVTLAVSQMTGIPVSKLGVDERTRYASMVEHLHERIIGQDEAVHAVSRAVKTARVGLKEPKRPIGSFLFLGPTGVGKTELAKALAEFMFGSEDAMLQLDMSEFQDESTINRLLGAPSGYVDSQAGGQLTERVRQQPYLIVLFDEVEKAHARVLDILLQLMEEGRLTDGRGNVASFAETVVIMTSNLGSRYLQKLDIVDESGQVREPVRQRVMDKVRAHFRPEFLNRLSEIVIFHPLSDENLRDILNLMLRREQKLADERGLALDFTEEAKNYLLAQNYHPEWGARPLRRIIQRSVREPLADFMLRENPVAGTTITIDANPDDGIVFDIQQATDQSRRPIGFKH
jgi:ATP-dependent Clp protease ATP-binding subunit ClpC